MTLYCAIFQFHNTGQCNIGRYASALERALAIIGFSAYADVLRQWEE